MSKARSPRDVCSTTMGTSGLMVLALFRSSIRIPAGGTSGTVGGSGERTNRLFAASTVRPPRRARGAEALRTWRPDRLFDARRVLLLGRPQLLARLRLLLGDRLGVLGQELDGEALRQLLPQAVQASGLLEALAELLGRGALARGRALQRVEHGAVGRLDALRLDHGGDDRLALDRELGVGARLGDDLVLGLAGDPQVVVARDALVAERMDHPLPQLVGARLDERLGPLHRRLLDDGVDDRLAELAGGPGLVGLAQLR